jgi:restriction system protein
MSGFFKKLSSFFELTIPPADQKNISVSPAKNAYQEAYENKEEFEDDLDNSMQDEQPDIDRPKIPSWFARVDINSKYWGQILNSTYDGYNHFINGRGIDFFDDWYSNLWHPIMDEQVFELSWPIITALSSPKEPHLFDPESRGLIEVLDAPLDILKKMYIEQFVYKGLGATKFRFERYKNKEWYEKDALEGWKQYAEDDWKEYKSLALKCKKNYQRINSENQEIFEQARAELKKSETCVMTLAKLIMRENKLPDLFKPNFQFSLDETEEFLQVQFDFPDYNDVEIEIDTLRNGDLKYASETAKKKLVKESLFSMMVWVGHVLGTQLQGKSVQQIGINVHQSWFDPATGQPASGIIASVMGGIDHLTSLNIKKVDPIACIRDLKGIVTPSLEKQSPIRPIFEMNTDDKRIVDSKDVDGTLVRGENLAMMPWEDFEHLVAQLFEWEFAKDGAEVKVTQASRDRGVDAILFDPDPIRGGKYVLQAKRYTLTVDVASVRDLYGTVMNEGANRGILITTSSYGPDSYEFAKDKPISLIDGPRLLEMLTKHGKDYKIDLKEARDLYGAEK